MSDPRDVGPPSSLVPEIATQAYANPKCDNSGEAQTGPDGTVLGDVRVSCVACRVCRGAYPVRFPRLTLARMRQSRGPCRAATQSGAGS